jgi:hypothetical protein
LFALVHPPWITFFWFWQFHLEVFELFYLDLILAVNISDLFSLTASSVIASVTLHILNWFGSSILVWFGCPHNSLVWQPPIKFLSADGAAIMGGAAIAFNVSLISFSISGNIERKR